MIVIQTECVLLTASAKNAEKYILGIAIFAQPAETPHGEKTATSTLNITVITTTKDSLNRRLCGEKVN